MFWVFCLLFLLTLVIVIGIIGFHIDDNDDVNKGFLEKDDWGKS